MRAAGVRPSCRRMNVELAEERVAGPARPDRPWRRPRQRAWAKRVDAFGTLAQDVGLLNRPKDDEFELVYKERRLQPFWRLERQRRLRLRAQPKTYVVKVAPEVQSVAIAGETKTDQPHGEFSLERSGDLPRGDAQGVPLRRPRQGGRTRSWPPTSSTTASSSPRPDLNAIAKAGVIVVPPQAKSSMIVREVVAAMLSKIDADKVLEETVRIERVDLFYRPVYAFRYRRARQGGGGRGRPAHRRGQARRRDLRDLPRQDPRAALPVRRDGGDRQHLLPRRDAGAGDRQQGSGITKQPRRAGSVALGAGLLDRALQRVGELAALLRAERAGDGQPLRCDRRRRTRASCSPACSTPRR